MKNIIVRTKKNTNPSNRINEESAATANEMYRVVFVLVKNKTREVVTKKTYSGSVNPNKEFCMIWGSKANNAAPNREYVLLTNFLHKKYTGIIVNIENEIVTNLCKVI